MRALCKVTARHCFNSTLSNWTLTTLPQRRKWRLSPFSATSMWHFIEPTATRRLRKLNFRSFGSISALRLMLIRLECFRWASADGKCNWLQFDYISGGGCAMWDDRRRRLRWGWVEPRIAKVIKIIKLLLNYWVNVARQMWVKPLMRNFDGKFCTYALIVSFTFSLFLRHRAIISRMSKFCLKMLCLFFFLFRRNFVHTNPTSKEAMLNHWFGHTLK